MFDHQPNRDCPIRLTRTQQLTLTTWRWAALKLDRLVSPYAVLEPAAVHAVLAALRDVRDTLALFARHSDANAEYRFIVSLVGEDHAASLANDILDTAFLLRWNELLAECEPLQELPPLRLRLSSADEPNVPSDHG
jgi:hypothetical protein